MIRKVILENYMSHARTEIEPAAGLTVLVGPNNCGKSAVVSALETLARNTAGNFMVRHGEKEARVTVETDDGPDDRHVLVWRRKASGSPSYVIDGREVHRLNRDVPEDLHLFLKLPKVQLNETDEPFDVHFGQQKSPIFLLNESESRAAMFFSASSDAGRLLEIQDRHRDKVRLQKNRKRDTETQISRLDARLEKLAEIDRVAPLMEAAEKQHQEIADELNAITALEQTIRQIESAGAHLATYRARATAHESLQPPPAQLDTVPLAVLIESLQGQSKAFERSRSIGGALTHLKSAPELVDTTPLQQAITALARTVGQLKIHNGRSLTLSPLHDPPAMDDPEHLAESIKAIESGTRSLRDRRTAAMSLAELRDPPAMLDPAPLEVAIKICSDAAQRSVFCMASVVKTVKQLQQAEEEIKAWARDNPNCPVCGGAIAPISSWNPEGIVMADRRLAGLLFVGDPHLSPRAPGFRKDEYAETVLGKLKWCVDYARNEKLLLVLLGDLFHHPRDISNRLLVELISLFREPVWTVAGNHDCSENSLTDNDTLAVLAAAGCVKLLDRDGPCVHVINGGTIVLGGTAWGQYLPKSFNSSMYQKEGEPVFTFWISHHDIRFPGYDDAGRFDCREIPGIDAIINGHIHRTLAEVKSGQTTWINPGNICRVSRSDTTREHQPRVLRFDVSRDGWTSRYVDVPHQPFDEVFHPLVAGETIELGESTFIRELAALESAHTSCGAGLQAFLDANLPQFPDPVANEIRELAKEVLTDGN